MSANYLVRRFFSTLLVIILSSVIVFAITNVLPGDAASMVLGEHATPQDLIAVRERLGLDQNVVLRYVEWLGGALLGAKPEQGFFVECGPTTMTADDLAEGRMICRIGISAAHPAEFVIFRISQMTATTSA